MPCMRHEKACGTAPRSGDRQKTCFFYDYNGYNSSMKGDGCDKIYKANILQSLEKQNNEN